MTYAEVKVGDVIDGVRIKAVEDEETHKTFRFDYVGGGWSFLVIYSCNYNKEARFVFPKRKENDDEERENDDEESEQLDFFDEQLDFFDEMA